jgi:lysophospholipase L1-like esterase
LTGPLPKDTRIVFLGDSITDDGTYIAYIDAYIQQHWPDRQITLINLGVSSETASGLSEPGHPFPRPCIHDRLSRALAKSKPDWVVICYGMNDGIYYPFAEDRFQQYQEGILKALHEVKQAGANAILMTPPPFDPLSLSGAALQPDGMAVYSYEKPYAHYNDVLRRYADWLLSLNNEVNGLVNIYDPLTLETAQQRIQTPDYLSGDGIHPNSFGHWIIAQALIKQLFDIALKHAPRYVSLPEEPSAFFDLIMKRHRLLSAAWKEYVGHTNPNKAAALPLHEALELGKEIGQQLKVTNQNLPDL